MLGLPISRPAEHRDVPQDEATDAVSKTPALLAQFGLFLAWAYRYSINRFKRGTAACWPVCPKTEPSALGPISVIQQEEVPGDPLPQRRYIGARNWSRSSYLGSPDHTREYDGNGLANHPLTY